MSLPHSTEIVIVGGGAVGCGIAFALARSGRTDVVVLEQRSGPALGTTSQGAGLCGQVRASVERTQLAMHSARTFAEMQTGNAPVKPGWCGVGSLRLAMNEARAAEFDRLAKVAGAAGLEVERIDLGRAQRMWPSLKFAGVAAVMWCPSDGYMIPAQVVRSYEHHCLEHGVRLYSDTSVTGIRLSGGRVEAVETSHGIIHCRYVINAAGPFAYRVARMVGLDFPIVAIRHQYFVTHPISGLKNNFPVLRIPDVGLYARVDAGGLLLGGWEEDCVSMDPHSCNGGNPDPPIEPDWQVLRGFASRFRSLLPAATETGYARIARGWPTFTPDGRFILGESGQIPGFVMAAGCNAHGISGSPGLGRMLVESLFDETPSAYVRSLSPDRFLNEAWTWPTVQKQAEALCRNYYEMEPFGEPAEAAVGALEHRIDAGQSLSGESGIHSRKAKPSGNQPRLESR